MSSDRKTTSVDLAGLVHLLAQVDRSVSDAERVDQITALEQVKAACAAAQARVTVDLAQSQQEIADAW